MRRQLLIVLAIVAVAVASASNAEGQVRVSVRVGDSHWSQARSGRSLHVGYGPAAYYRCGYHGCGRAVVVRERRPRPVVVVRQPVVVRDRYHRGGYRHR